MPSEHLWVSGWHLWGVFFYSCSSSLSSCHRLTVFICHRGRCHHLVCCRNRGHCRHCHCRCQQRRGRPPVCRCCCHCHQCHCRFQTGREQLRFHRSQMGALGCPFVCLSLSSICHSLSYLTRFLSEAFPCSGVSFLFPWLSLLRSYSRVSLGLLVRLVVSTESRMLETFFRPPSMSLDLSILLDPFPQVQVSGTLPGTLFRCLSAVSSPF